VPAASVLEIVRTAARAEVPAVSCGASLGCCSSCGWAALAICRERRLLRAVLLLRIPVAATGTGPAGVAVNSTTASATPSTHVGNAAAVVVVVVAAAAAAASTLTQRCRFVRTCPGANDGPSRCSAVWTAAGAAAVMEGTAAVMGVAAAVGLLVCPARQRAAVSLR